METPILYNHNGSQKVMKTTVMMNSKHIFFKVLVCVAVILVAAVTCGNFIVPLCTFTLALMEIFEGPEIQQRSGQSIVDISIIFLGIPEVPGCDESVALRIPTRILEALNFFNSVAAIMK